MDHVHSPETWYISFRFVDLHHRHFLVNKRHLSIKPFVNPTCRNAWISDVKCTHRPILPFTHFECGPVKLTDKQTKWNYPEEIQNTNHFTGTFTLQQLNTSRSTCNLTFPCLERYFFRENNYASYLKNYCCDVVAYRFNSVACMSRTYIYIYNIIYKRISKRLDSVKQLKTNDGHTVSILNL